MLVVRAIALLVIFSVGGLSSSLALCLAACADEAPANVHACHQDAPTVTVSASSGACAHASEAPVIGEMARDDRTPVALVQPALLPWSRVQLLTRHDARQHLSLPPPVLPRAPQILRI